MCGGTFRSYPGWQFTTFEFAYQTNGLDPAGADRTGPVGPSIHPASPLAPNCCPPAPPDDPDPLAGPDPLDGPSTVE